MPAGIINCSSFHVSRDACEGCHFPKVLESMMEGFNNQEFGSTMPSFPRHMICTTIHMPDPWGLRYCRKPRHVRYSCQSKLNLQPTLHSCAFSVPIELRNHLSQPAKYPVLAKTTVNSASSITLITPIVISISSCSSGRTHHNTNCSLRGAA